MKKVSVRKMSILGIVLLAASAVTAAVLPSKVNDMQFDGSADDGTLISNSGVELGSGGALSCVQDATQNFSCNRSLESGGTVTGAISSNTANHTVNNTSLSTPNDGNDTTSAA